jgi:hypothetical protein
LVAVGAPFDVDAVEWSFVARDEASDQSYRVGRRGNAIVAEWGGSVWLEATPQGDRISLATAFGVDPFLLRKLENGPISALLRRLRGDLTFHGGAASRDGLGLLVLGDSGMGKSTTVAALVRAGYALVADDMTWVDFDGTQPMLVPSESHVFLEAEPMRALGLSPMSDHVFWDATTKCGAVARAGETKVPLAAIAVLGWGEQLEVKKLGALEAWTAIVPHVARCGIVDKDTRLAEFENLSRVLVGVVVYDVRRPKDFSALSEYVEALVHLTRTSS